MGVSKEHLVGQLASLEQEKELTIGRIHQIDGAARLCRTLIGKLEREEDEAKAKADEAQPTDAAPPSAAATE